VWNKADIELRWSLLSLQYTREVVEVLAAGRPQPVRALVYSATPDNPGFSATALKDLPHAARIIAHAHGPSGANIEYLRQLHRWLCDIGEKDQHINRLMALVDGMGS